MNDTIKYAVLLNRADAAIRIVHMLEASERETIDFELAQLVLIERIVEKLLGDASPVDVLEDLFQEVLEAISDQIPAERKPAMLERCKNQLLNRIAEEYLEIDSLETFNPEDMLYMNICRIKDALKAAFEAGKESGDFENLIDKGGDDD